jgi:GNAT superfamily N-acetyltransferase
MNNYGMNYNPPYYPALFEKYGFNTYFEQYLFKRRIADPVPDVFKRRIEILQKRYNIRVSNLEGVSLATAAEYFRTVYNEAWGGYSDFNPMTFEAAQSLMKELKPVLEKRILIFAFHENKPIGFFVNIPELNEIFKFVDGNLNIIGKLKFLYHKWKGTPKTMVGLVFGVAKEWQGRGIEGAMINWASEFFTEHPIYKDIVLTWIGDFNPRMLKVAEKIGAKKFREMKTYRYLFDREKPFKRYPVVE